MISDRKKPSAGFWITVALVAVLVGYPLSFGPACWITSRTNVGSGTLSVAYRPLTLMFANPGPIYPPPPDRIGKALRSYARFAAKDGWDWHPERDWIPTTREMLDTWTWEWKWWPPAPAA